MNSIAITANDVPLLTDVLDVLPSMHNTAYAVKIIEQQLSYPIANLHALLKVFDGRSYIVIRNCNITPDEVMRFLPEACFPIDNRRHLIAHLIMAFEREHLSVVSRLAAAQDQEATRESKDV